MNPPELLKLARELRLEDDDQISLRVAFGIACIERVENLLTEQKVSDCLRVGKRFLKGEASEYELTGAARRAAELATSHKGSNSLDGSGNAAVSTSYGVAAALDGRALEAAEYAAYAKVYSYASYAVTDLANYGDEHIWQISALNSMRSYKETEGT
jgi:hypothetical protein